MKRLPGKIHRSSLIIMQTDVSVFIHMKFPTNYYFPLIEEAPREGEIED
jgi:hypothetical protein